MVLQAVNCNRPCWRNQLQQIFIPGFLDPGFQLCESLGCFARSHTLAWIRGVRAPSLTPLSSRVQGMDIFSQGKMRQFHLTWSRVLGRLEITIVHRTVPTLWASLLLFFKDFIYFSREGKGRRNRGRETSMFGCLSHAPYWGPGP